MYLGKRTHEAMIAWIELRIVPPWLRRPSPTPPPTTKKEETDRADAAIAVDSLEPLSIVIRRATPTPTQEGEINKVVSADTVTREMGTAPFGDEVETREVKSVNDHVGYEEEESLEEADCEDHCPQVGQEEREDKGEGKEATGREKQTGEEEHDIGGKAVSEEKHVIKEVEEGASDSKKDDQGEGGVKETVRSFDGTKLLLRKWPVPGPMKGVVLFLHDLGLHCAHNSYTKLFKEIHSQDFMIYCFDMRGHGSSSGVRGTY